MAADEDQHDQAGGERRHHPLVPRSVAEFAAAPARELQLLVTFGDAPAGVVGEPDHCGDHCERLLRLHLLPGAVGGEVARAVGLADAHDFFRVFARRVGQPPGA